MSERVVCAICKNPAVWDGEVWRHDVSTEELQFASSFCERYGYPIPVRGHAGQFKQANEKEFAQ